MSIHFETTESGFNDLLTTKEVATLLRCSVRTIRGYVASGRLKAERYSKRMLRYHRSDVEAFRTGV